MVTIALHTRKLKKEKKKKRFSLLLYETLLLSYPGELRGQRWPACWAVNEKKKMEKEKQWRRANTELLLQTQTYSPLPCTKCGWADYNCKLIFTPIRANFHFQMITERMLKVALISNVLFAILTSSGSCERKIKMGLTQMSGWFKMSLSCFYISDDAKRRNVI